MSIEFTHKPEQNYLLVKISGILDMEQLQQAALKLMNSNSFSPNINTIYDMSEMDFSNITTEFEQQVIEFRKQLDRGDAKIACVTPSDAGFGMGRMYEVFSGDLPQQVRVFRTIQEAEDWLS